MKRTSGTPTESSCLVKKHKELEEIVASLECTVCLKHLQPNPKGTFSCSNGHFTCQDCHQEPIHQHGIYNLTCSVCRVRWTDNKNMVAEALLELEYRDRKIPCKNEGLCFLTDYLGPLLKHETVCFYRKTACPASLNRNCTWRGSMVDLADHIKRTDCSRLVLDCKNRTAEANKISFRGNLTNRVGK